MKKVIKITSIAVVLCLIIGTFIYLYKQSQPQPVTYDTFPVVVGNLSTNTLITGTVEPRDEVLIKPRISGIISELLKEPGDKVKKGDVIAKVKVIPDMQTLSSAQSAVKIAQINEKQAHIDFEREAQLYKEELVSADEYDKYKKEYEEAKERLRSAHDNLEIAQTGVSKSQQKMSNTLIVSTLDGIILDIPIKIGTSVIMSNTFNDGTTIASVANMNDLVFKGYIDETDVAYLQQGMPIQITIGALPEQVFDARLEFIAPKVNTSNSAANQYEIRAAVKIPDGTTIRAGYSANASIILKQAKNVLTIPEGTVLRENGKTFVYVQQSDGSFQKRYIDTGMSDGINIMVVKGLKKGEKVRSNTPNNAAPKNDD